MKEKLEEYKAIVDAFVINNRYKIIGVLVAMVVVNAVF